jgi:hypothetical protein
MTSTFTEEQWLNRTTMGSGSVTAISNVVKQISSTAIPCKEVILHAAEANTINLRISGSDVSTSKGVQLQPGEDLTLTINDISLLYVIAESAGNETLTYSYTL